MAELPLRCHRAGVVQGQHRSLDEAKVILYHGTAWKGIDFWGSIASALWCCRTVDGHEVLHGGLIDLSLIFISILSQFLFQYTHSVLFLEATPIPHGGSELRGAELL